MLLATRLEQQSRPSAVHLLLCVLTVLSITRVRGHAPPRALYYGHRVSPQERLSQIPSVLYEMRSPSGGMLEMPSCSQLRYLWKSSVRDIAEARRGANNDGLATFAPSFANNPYYMAMLWHRNEPAAHFGRIVTSATPTPTRKSDDVPAEEAKGKGQAAKSSETAAATATSPAADVSRPLPGHFLDKQSDVGVVYGHVLHDASESRKKPRPGAHRSAHTSSRHNSVKPDGEDGKWGRFVTEVEVDDDQADERDGDSQFNYKHHQPRFVTQQRAQGMASAADFFNSGVWHNKPVKVIPSM